MWDEVCQWEWICSPFLMDASYLAAEAKRYKDIGYRTWTKSDVEAMSDGDGPDDDTPCAYVCVSTQALLCPCASDS